MGEPGAGALSSQRCAGMGKDVPARDGLLLGRLLRGRRAGRGYSAAGVLPTGGWAGAGGWSGGWAVAAASVGAIWAI